MQGEMEGIMDLKTFVAESLKQIAEGIKEGQAADTGAWICPLVTDESKPKAHAPNNNYPSVQEIDFDIAVTVTEDSRAEGGAKLSVVAVMLGGKMETLSANSTVSRIRFSLPVRWPIAATPQHGQGKFDPPRGPVQTLGYNNAGS